MKNPNLKTFDHTVGILIYHRTEELVTMAQECLGSVLANIDRNTTELIIVDNGSPIRSNVWEKNADTYIRFSENKGISRGWNAILNSARGKYITIIGDDVKVRQNWLSELQKAKDMPKCGVANIHVEHLPVGIGIVETYKWPSGACFMLDKNTINTVGYFDETIFPANTEDWDYWIRLYQHGLKFYRNYGCSIQHLEGQTVHSPDISAEHNRLLMNLRKKYGFDPVPIFCGDTSMPDFSI